MDLNSLTALSGARRGAVILQNAEDIDAPVPELDPGTVVFAIVTFVVAYALARIVAIVLSAISERTIEYRITIKTFVPVVKFLIYVAAIVIVLGPILDLTTGQLLAFSGLLGAALGLGIKDLFANVIGGIVIVFARPYTTGDKIEIDDHYGEVTDLGIRSTKLRTNEDDEVSVPNYHFITEPVSNANSGRAELMAVPEVYLANDADVAEAVTVYEEALYTSPYVYVSEDHPVTVRVVDEPAYITLRGKAYVNDVRHEFAFRSDVTQRTLKSFEQRGIETPDVAVSLE